MCWGTETYIQVSIQCVIKDSSERANRLPESPNATDLPPRFLPIVIEKLAVTNRFWKALAFAVIVVAVSEISLTVVAFWNMTHRRGVPKDIAAERLAHEM